METTKLQPAVLLVLAAVLRIGLLNVNDYKAKADEGYYRRYACALAQDPRASLKGLADAYLANPKWHRFPSPLRFGHILLSSAWMRLHGRYDFAILSALSTYFAIATLLLAYAFTRELFGGPVALAALALLAASPLHLALGRRALQDAVVDFFILASVAAYERMLRTRSRAWTLAFSAAFFAAVICKESSVLLLVFFVSWPAVERLVLGRPLVLKPVLLSAAAPLAAAAASWLWLCGGPARFLRMGEILVLGQRGNPYVLRYQSGSVLRYLYDFLLASPLTLLLAATALRRRSRDPNALFLATFFAATYLAYSGFAKNLRYVLALDFPLRVFAALAVWRLTPRRSLRWAAVLALALADLFLFKKLFLDGRIYDPVTADLVDAWKDLLALTP